MKEAYYQAIQMLKTCTFFPGCFDKRFLRSLAKLSPDADLSEKQTQQIERCAFQYRRQLKARGYIMPLEVLEPYFERRRREKTPDQIKFFWVKER